jgi:predicted short-subunit dehydrogenase-like oxidoreductase (DUF2520 family)
MNLSTISDLRLRTSDLRLRTSDFRLPTSIFTSYLRAMRIVMIGTGNVATVLGKKIVAAGHDIVQVWGRSEMAAASLAKTLAGTSTTHLKQLDTNADLYIIAVSDGAIEQVVAGLPPGKKLVVHTAGSVSKEVLKPCTSNYGILYPLQSLRKEITEVPVIPFLVDGNTEDDTALLVDFARTLSNDVQVANDEKRLRWHVAAVVVSNFSNHLYALAENYCRQEQVDFRLLLPLINAVAGRLYRFSPAEVQTGPAVRADEDTIQKHLQLLAGYPQLQEMYRLFSASIGGMYNRES